MLYDYPINLITAFQGENYHVKYINQFQILISEMLKCLEKVHVRNEEIRSSL